MVVVYAGCRDSSARDVDPSSSIGGETAPNLLPVIAISGGLDCVVHRARENVGHLVRLVVGLSTEALAATPAASSVKETFGNRAGGLWSPLMARAQTNTSFSRTCSWLLNLRFH